MPKLTILGSIQNTTREVISGLRVTAWDKDKKVSDYIGSGYSDAKGRFQINIEDNRFADGPEDYLPDVFFLIYNGDKLIHSTENSPIKNPKDLRKLVLEITTSDLSNIEATPSYYVHGTIIDRKTKTPITNLKIEAWDKDKSLSDHLGTTVSDQNGSFHIDYDSSKFKDDHTDYLPDVFFRIYEGLEMIYSTEAKPLKNVKQKKDIVIRFDYSKPDTGPSAPKLTKTTLLNLAKNSSKTPDELIKKDPKLYNAIKEKAHQEVKNISTNLFADSSPDIKLYIHNLDYTKLKDNNESIKDFVLKLLDTSNLSDSNKNEAIAILEDWDSQEKLNDIIKPDQTLKDNSLLQDSLDNAHLYNIAQLSSLKDEVVEELLSRNITISSLDRDKLKTLVTDKILSKKQAKDLSLNVNIHSIANGNIGLSKAIKNHNRRNPIKSISDLAALGERDWKSILKKARIVGSEEEIARIALIKKKQIETMFPHHAFKAQSNSFEKPEVRSLMSRFYSMNESLNFLDLDYQEASPDLNKLNLSNFSETDKQSIVSNLKTNQRLFALTNDVSDSFQIKMAGYESAHEITLTGYTNFAESTNLEEPVALNYFGRAMIEGLNVNVGVGNIADIVNSPFDISPFDNTSPDIHSFLRRLNGYEEFFGETDFCRCEHCASIISPSAYFMDLMIFIKENVIDKHFRGFPSEQPVISPGVRRPDLWDGLVLNCRNTNELVPYLLIINEVLENFIYMMETEVSFAGLPNRNTIEVFVYELLSKNTTAYTIDSFRQPFHLPLNELEIYLQHFPITRASIVETLLAHVQDTRDISTQANLKLSTKEFEMISTDRSANSSENRKFFRDLFKVHTLSRGTVLPINVIEMLRGMGISRDELTSLIDTYFITSNHTQVPIFVAERTPDSLQNNIEYLDGLTPGILDRMHRFTRLSNNIRWSIEELDKVIECIHKSLASSPEILQDLMLDEIVELISIQKSLNINIDELCTLIHELPTSGEESFFDQRFNLPAFITEESDIWSAPNLTPGGITFQHSAYVEGSGASAPTDLQHRLLAGLGLNDEELYLIIKNLELPLRVEATGVTRGRFTLNVSNLSLLFTHSLLLKKYRLSVDELFFLIRISPNIGGNYLVNIDDIKSLVELIEWQRKSDYSLPELAYILNDSLSPENLYENATDMAYDIWSQIQSDQSLLFSDTIFAYFEGISEQQSRAIVKENNSVIIPADLRIFRVSTNTSVPSTFNLDIPSSIYGGLNQEQRVELVATLMSLIVDQLSSITSTFDSNVLENISGLTEEESRLIISTNAAIFELISGSSTEYRLISTIRSSPPLIGLSVPSPIWTGLSADEKDTLYIALIRRITRYMQQGAPEVSDRLFVDTAGLDLTQSREILLANPSIFEEVESENLFWLSPDFDPEVLIDIPLEVPLLAGEAQKMLITKHVSSIISNQFEGRFGFNSEKIKTLSKLSGYDLEIQSISSQLTQIVQGNLTLTLFEQLTENLLKLSVWFKDPIFNPETLAFVHENSGDNTQIFQINSPADFQAPSINHVQIMELYKQLRDKLRDRTDDLHIVLAGYNYTAPTPLFVNEVFDELANVLGADVSLIGTLNANIIFPSLDSSGDLSNLGLKSLDKFHEIVQLVQYLGIGGEAIPLFLSSDYNEHASAVETIVTAIRTKYETEEQWQEKIGPFEDSIREKKRDALSDYLINSFRFDNPDTSADDKLQWFRTDNDLYNYFLIDTELEGCARTSRVVAGISSLQLYVQRCLMNLEQNEDVSVHVKPGDIPSGQWEWRKNYRVWEANRKVFLYPENYIEPDLRDNKTELFKELESELLQQEINSQNALDAYSRYMKGFEELSNLQIAGSYHDYRFDDGIDNLYLFGVTSSDPPQYYYRVIKNIYRWERDSKSYGIVYEPWKKLNLNIPVKKVSPIFYRGKLYIFWTEIVTNPAYDFIDGTRIFNGYDHKMSVKFSHLKLDGTWLTPQDIDMSSTDFADGSGIIVDPIWDSAEANYFINHRVFWEQTSSGRIIMTERSVEIIFGKIYSELANYLKSNKHLPLHGSHHLYLDVDGREIDFTFDFGTDWNRKLLIPQYQLDRKIHLEPIEGYTIFGHPWDRVYPEVDVFNQLVIVGKNYEMRRAVDLYNLNLVPASSLPSSSNPFAQELRRISSFSGSIGYSFLPSTHSTGYADATRFSNSSGGATQLLFSEIIPSVNVINGALSDAVLEFNSKLLEYGNDTLYLHSTGHTGYGGYALKRLGTTLDSKISRRLFETGIDGLLDINYQENEVKEYPIPAIVDEDQVWNDAGEFVGKMDTKGSMGVYFREIFFHIPYLIANHLNSQGKYADALKWYNYIFDPTSNKLPDLVGITDPEEKQKRMADRVWQYIEFRNHTLKSWRENLNDSKAIQSYENDPFNPHAIARLRLGAYMKSIVMKYIDNLLDWGDSLFAKDTMESINEATLLYVMASEILGPPPNELGDCENDDNDLTYSQLYSRMQNDVCREFLREVETITNSHFRDTINIADEDSPIVTIIYDAEKYSSSFYSAIYGLIGDSSSSESDESSTITAPTIDIGGIEESIYPDVGGFSADEWREKIPDIIDIFSFHTSFLKQVCLFCIPPNEDLHDYWDRVQDRLFKIRNCMNISGLKRQIPLFSPEIDPRLLVRAKAQGLSLEDVLNSIQGEVPPFRFAFLIAKAKEYTSVLQSYGNALMGVLEKKQSEELNLLRLVHQDNIIKMTSQIRNMEIDSAEASLEGLRLRKTNLEVRKNYFTELISSGLNSWESSQLGLLNSSFAIDYLISPLYLASAIAGIPPRRVGTSNSTGSEEAAESIKSFAEAFRTGSGLLQRQGNIQGILGGFDRREQAWKFNIAQIENELKEIDRQIETAEIRRDIALKSNEIHQKTIDQAEELYEFHNEKFTNLGRYTWLSTQVQRLYREAYQDALYVARMAERAFRYEKNDDTSVLIEGSYWDSSKAGLLSGEKLMTALRNMELKFIETSAQTMEIDQAFSLTQLDPSAILSLKSTGKCEFTIPEFYFDLFYPGQYRRKITSARLTIPCITGPYTNVSATLSLTESEIRKEPKLGRDNLFIVPPSRSVTIATSTAQNDAGVFNVNFKEERYMPFEGVGAVNSKWKLSLPSTFRSFDYSTINDVILHISYTAQYSEDFRDDVESVSETITGNLNTYLGSNPIPRMFSLRQEFSQAFNQLTHSELDTEIRIELSEKHFPYFLLGKELNITTATLVIEAEEENMVDDTGTPIGINPTITIEGNNGDSTLNSFVVDSKYGLPSHRVPTTILLPFNPTNFPLTIKIVLNDAGNLAPATSSPSDISAIDDHKLKDVYLYVEYVVV